jgi:D-alanyl-D-alanine dipeptidase
MNKVLVQIIGLAFGLIGLLPQDNYAGELYPLTFVRLKDIAPSIRQDIRYATRFNFTGARVPGYVEPECILLRPVAEALARAQNRLSIDGFQLKVYDCYRPIRAVRAFADWSKDPSRETMKPVFYPTIDKSRLFSMGYIANRSKHSVGIAVDVGLVRIGDKAEDPTIKAGACDGPFDQRMKESSLDFGTSYDCFSDLSATANPMIPAGARSNRMILSRALTKEGFRNYPREWWHFEFDQSPQTRAFDFLVQ